MNYSRNMVVGWNLGHCFPILRRQLRVAYPLSSLCKWRQTPLMIHLVQCSMSEVMEKRLATIIEALDLSLISTENSVTCAPCLARSFGTERSLSKDMEVSSCGASYLLLLIRWWNAYPLILLLPIQCP